MQPSAVGGRSDVHGGVTGVLQACADATDDHELDAVGDQHPTDGGDVVVVKFRRDRWPGGNPQPGAAGGSPR